MTKFKDKVGRQNTVDRSNANALEKAQGTGREAGSLDLLGCSGLLSLEILRPAFFRAQDDRGKGSAQDDRSLNYPTTRDS